MTAKKIGKGDIIGQQGVNLIEQIVLEMGFAWYATGGVEAGIDGTIEIRDPATGEVFNRIIQVQSKATEGTFLAETPDGFDFICDARDLDYWLHGNVPVILIRSRPSTKEAYWVSIKDSFPDLATRAKHKVHFDKKRDRFDKACAQRLAQLGTPENIDVHLTPAPRKEKLWSNLLEVTSFASKLYSAPTDLRLDSDALDILYEMGESVGLEWFLKNQQLMSFHNLEEYPWRELCDPGAMECFDTSEWAYSSDRDKQREFVWLLNKALEQKLTPAMQYSKKKGCYFFRATEDLSTLTLPHQNIKKKGNRTVFQGYESKTHPGRIAYYRHSAFEGQFRRIEGAWFLEITPTYYFTSNGYRLSRWYEERLRGIKRLDRNPQVLAQLVMWADYLSKADLFSVPYPYLTFGWLQTFTVETGVDDALWLGHEEDESTKAAEGVPEQMGLFDL